MKLSKQLTPPALSDVRRRALALIAEDGKAVAVRLARSAGISRQAAHGHLKALLDAGLVSAHGSTRSREYTLELTREEHGIYSLKGLSEDVPWRENFVPVLSDLPGNVRDIWHYGVTEMVNNAIDHSGASDVQAGVRLNMVFAEGYVFDQGEGIFRKIQRAFGLDDAREAILELSKGKVTTDPKRHTGEGIFFSARMFDLFYIRSGQLDFVHREGRPDQIVDRKEEAKGTLVFMRLANESARTTKAVFDAYALPEEYSFSKTVVAVRLALHEGEKLISRSQAKRLSKRFDQFRHVVLDFEGVEDVGQAFADELFRVFQSEHPGLLLEPVHMAPPVKRMVSRALAVADDDGPAASRPEAGD